MLKYGKNIIFNPEKLDPLNIDRQSVLFVPQGSRVLEIGCATGFMGKYLQEKKGCRVTGVELGKEEAKTARKYLEKVIEGDIEDPLTVRKISGTFDIIFCSAIIEHLKDPWVTLANLRRFLNPNGKLVVTTSNIAHWSTRLQIMQGNFDYANYGILDTTHLRFFTTKSFPRLIADSGFIVEEFLIDPVGGGMPRISKLLSRFFPNLFAYQMLIVARLK